MKQFGIVGVFVMTSFFSTTKAFSLEGEAALNDERQKTISKAVKQLGRGQIKSPTFPSYKSVKLDNGLTIWFVEDSLPYVSLVYQAQAGGRYDTLSQRGLASLVGSLLGKQTKQMSREKLAEELDFLSADFAMDIGQESSLAQASVVSGNETKLLELFYQILSAPVFNLEDFEIAKQQTLTLLASSPDDSSGFLSHIVQNFMLAGTSYKELSGVRSTVKMLQLKDVKGFYQQRYRPEKSTLLVIGKYSKSFAKRVEKTFSQMDVASKNQKYFQQKKMVAQRMDAIRHKGKRELLSFGSSSKKENRWPVYLIHREEGINQAEVVLAKPHLSRNHPDFVPFFIVNSVIAGGSFSSRITNEVRVKHGLVYGIYTEPVALKDTGYLKVSASTGHHNVGVLLEKALGVFKEASKNGMSVDELKLGKSSMQGTVLRVLSGREKAMLQALNLRLLGLSTSYYEQYFAPGFELKQANHILKKYFDPKDFVIFVYANKNSKGGEADPKSRGNLTVLQQLSKISAGPVNVIPYKNIEY